MRRLSTIIVVLSLVAAACGDDDQSAPAERTTTTTTAPATSTAETPSTTTAAPGMCGDLTPVVTEDGTTCVDPDAPETTPLALPPTSSAVRLVIAEDTQIRTYTLGDSLEIVDGPVTDNPVSAVRQSADGTIFVREYSTGDESELVIEIVRYAADGTRTVVDQLSDLYDVAVVDGVEAVIGATPPPDEFGSFGGVVALAVDDLRLVADLGLGAEAVFGVTDFSWSEAASLGVASAWADLTEWVGFVDLSGADVALPSPTDELAYNSPPYVTAAALSLDGTTLYWAEGPDWGFDVDTDESGPVEGPWVLRSADLRTGEERLFWPLSEPVLDSTVLNVESIEDLGGRILVNRSTLDGTTPTPLAPLVLDLTVEEPELSEFPAVGFATAAATAG